MKKYCLLFVLILVLCGCESWHNKYHLTWAVKPWGTTYYSYSNFALQVDEFKKNLASQQQHYLQLGSETNDAASKMILKKIAYANLWLEHSGLYNLEKIEECSDRIGNNKFRNEFLFCFNDDKEKGFLELLMSSPNQNLADELAIITDNTVFCCNLQLKLKDFLAKYPRTEEFESFNNLLIKHNILNFTVEQLAETSDGNWGVLVNQQGTGKQAVYDILISIPDSNGTLFPAICERLINNKLASLVSGNPNKLQVVSFGEFQPVIVKRDGYVFIYSSEKTIENIVKNVKVGEYAKKIQEFNVPEKIRGNSFVYCDKNFMGFLVGMTANHLLNINGDFDSLSIISNQGDSILITQYSDANLNQLYANKIVLNFSKLLEIFLIPQLQQENLINQNIADSKECVAYLKDFYETEIKNFIIENKGKYPNKKQVESKFDGEKYCYIEPINQADKTKWPLLFDRQNNHGKSINVLFADGNIKSFEIENVGSPKKVVSYLHSLYRYDANIFAELLKQAK